MRNWFSQALESYNYQYYKHIMHLFTTVFEICLLLEVVSAFSSTVPQSATSSVPPDSSYDENVYWNQYTEGQRLDQGAYKSPLFWEQVDKHIPLWRTDPAYERFRGFCDNLQNEEPGKEIELPNGQQLLAQYVYPGLNDGDSTPTCKNVVRKAYPTDEYKELRQLHDRLGKLVRPVAQAELDALLAEKPLVGDDDVTMEDNTPVNANNDEDSVGETWQRAAWYGWQYLNLRGAKKNMPKTAKALDQAMGNLGPAHRFVGLSRQKANCEGVVHSDGRNYMLSTLTPIIAPAGHCGIFVDGIDAKIEETPVILDNTFPHYIYNTHEDMDRFCIMSECYHPALTRKERDAISTLFAVKDRFTVKELRLAPWGYDDDDLLHAMNTGAVDDLAFWKEINYNPKKKNTQKGKGAAPKGFGK